MELPKDRADRERYERYKKIIDTINSHLEEYGNIKSACVAADIPYRHYFLAKDYFINGGKTKPRDALRRKQNMEKMEKIQNACLKVDPIKKQQELENMLKNKKVTGEKPLQTTSTNLNSEKKHQSVSNQPLNSEKKHQGVSNQPLNSEKKHQGVSNQPVNSEKKPDKPVIIKKHSTDGKKATFVNPEDGFKPHKSLSKEAQNEKNKIK